MSARPDGTSDRGPIIDVQHLFKRYQELTAVDGISFAVPRGEFFGLLGPNGAGKTTTIRMLCGFTPPTRGVIRIFGMTVLVPPTYTPPPDAPACGRRRGRPPSGCRRTRASR